MKPCCGMMAEMIQLQGERGFSVQLVPDANTSQYEQPPLFIFRACDIKDEEAVTIYGGVFVSLVGKIGFQFCPWCGKHLTSMHPSIG